MRDFTLQAYTKLLQALQKEGYFFQTFQELIEEPVREKTVVMRHDIDRLPLNALKFAEIENSFGIKASYYFRMVKNVYDESIIKKILNLGHEVGYHYETMDTCKGDVDKAYDLFCENLAKMRTIVSVKTICMHGSPLSKYDNRVLWEKYDYRELDVVGEPYFDADYSKVLYLTDTGRGWDNRDSSIRDKVQSGYDIVVKSTFDLIKIIAEGKLPDELIINTHPQRWTDNWVLWTKELVAQNVKNQVKKVVSRRSQKNRTRI